MVYIRRMNITFAERVLLGRKWLNINQEELANRAGISRTYVSKIETGAVKAVMTDVVIRLAHALQVKPEFLLGLTDIPSDDPGTPVQTTEATITFEVKDRELRRLVQELIAILVELAPEDRQLVLDVAERMWRSEKREPRIVGD